MINRLTKKAGFLLAIAGAAVVGGATTALVTAAIPSTADGQIHGCYRNSASITDVKGSLRVIDSDANQTCSSQESVLNWNRGGFVDNLTGADFSQASLQYRNFSNINLRDGSLDGAFLSGSVFRGANLSNVSLLGAVLRSADFSGANLSGSKFSSALSGYGGASTQTNFRNVNFSGATITNMTEGDYRGSNFNSTTFVTDGGVFGPSDMTGVNFSQSIFPQEYAFNGVNMKATNFSGLTLRNFRVQQSDISNANFSNTNFSGGPDVSAFFINNTNASGVNFTNAYMNHVSFLGTNLGTAILSGVTWVNTTCPDGTNSDNNGNTCIGHLFP